MEPFRILIVDIHDVFYFAGVHDRLLKAFEGIVKPVVLHADGLSEAEEKIQNAINRGRPYHVVLVNLDVIGHEILCGTIGAKCHKTIVAHITKDPNALNTMEHLLDYHVSYGFPRCIVQSSQITGWQSLLANQLRNALLSISIDQKLDNLFGGRGQSPVQARSLTHDLASTCRDIVAAWDYLDDKLKQRVRDMFSIDEHSQPIRISLL